MLGSSYQLEHQYLMQQNGVVGPCSSDNEDAVLDYAHRLAKLQEEVKIKSLWLCVFIQLNLVQMVMVIKGLSTNLMLKVNQT